MSDIAIRVENLSKRYRIGLKEEMHDTMAGALVDLARRPMHNLRRLRRLTRFSENGQGPEQESDDVIWALRDVSFEVRRGEALGIIGRNGAGKSTLLKVLSRITHPTSGRVELNGRISSLLEVGTGFHGELTGRENVYLNATILGMRKAEIDRKFDEIVHFSGVEKFIDTPVKRYSSGMGVRLAFSVAAHLEPEVLLIDEVLAVGDAEFQKKCLGKMSEVAREGRTVLFVSHNLVALQSLCQRALWLDHGKVMEDDSSKRVIPSYLEATTSQFSKTEQIWPDVSTAPGNDEVRLHRVQVRPENDAETKVITMQTPLIVEVEYWNLVPDTILDVTLHLIYAEHGIVAFTSGSAMDPEWYGRKLPAGLFRSRCRIPANLLNSGQYRILLLVVRNLGHVIFTYDNVATFAVVDMAERQGGWFGREPGVVQPHLQWTTLHMGNLA